MGRARSVLRGFADRVVGHVDASVLGRRTAWPWFDHAARALGRYQSRHGNRLAAAITYYAFLSLFPLIALAFAAVGYAVAYFPSAKDYVTRAISDVLPGLAADLPVQQIASAKAGAGILGLLLLLWGGLGWVGALRGSLRVIWFDRDDEGDNFAVAKAKDAVTLVALGLTLLVSVLTTSFTTTATHVVLQHLGWEHVGGATWLVRGLTTVIALGSNMIVYLLMFARLSGTRASVRQVLPGALLGAVGMEALKLVATSLIGHATGNPVYATFAVAIGLLVWINFSSRLILVAAAWTATLPRVLAAESGPVDDRLP